MGNILCSHDTGYSRKSFVEMQGGKDSELIVVDEKYNLTQKEEKEKQNIRKRNREAHMYSEMQYLSIGTISNFHEERGELVEHEPNLVTGYKFFSFIRFAYALPC